MNTSAKGADYERDFRAFYDAKYNDHRTKVFWQPPKPRQHSTGFDAMSWVITWDDEGGLLTATPPTLWEFKGGTVSCMAMEDRILWKLDHIRPSFCDVKVVHPSKKLQFCIHGTVDNEPLEEEREGLHTRATATDPARVGPSG